MSSRWLVGHVLSPTFPPNLVFLLVTLQAVEKALKAAILRYGRDTTHGHNLLSLKHLIVNADLRSELDDHLTQVTHCDLL